MDILKQLVEKLEGDILPVVSLSIELRLLLRSRNGYEMKTKWKAEQLGECDSGIYAQATAFWQELSKLNKRLLI